MSVASVFKFAVLGFSVWRKSTILHNYLSEMYTSGFQDLGFALVFACMLGVSASRFWGVGFMFTGSTRARNMCCRFLGVLGFTLGGCSCRISCLGLAFSEYPFADRHFRFLEAFPVWVWRLLQRQETYTSGLVGLRFRLGGCAQAGQVFNSRVAYICLLTRRPADADADADADAALGT